MVCLRSAEVHTKPTRGLDTEHVIPLGLADNGIMKL